MSDIMLITCSLLYFLISAYNIYTGYLYLFDEGDLNKLPLPDKEIKKYNTTKLKIKLSTKEGIERIIVGIIELILGYSYFNINIEFGFIYAVLVGIAFWLGIITLIKIVNAHKNKKRIIIPIIKLCSFLVIFLCTFNYPLFNISENTIKSNYVGYNIVYIRGAKEYHIKTKEYNMEIEEYEQIECIKAPCNPIKRKTYTVIYTKDNLNTIEKIINDNNNSKEINIYYLDPNDYDDLSKLDEIIFNEKRR